MDRPSLGANSLQGSLNAEVYQGFTPCFTLTFEPRGAVKADFGKFCTEDLRLLRPRPQDMIYRRLSAVKYGTLLYLLTSLNLTAQFLAYQGLSYFPIDPKCHGCGQSSRASGFRTNGLGTVTIMQSTLPAMHAQGFNRTLNVSAYNALGTTLDAFTDALCTEIIWYSVHVSAIVPATPSPTSSPLHYRRWMAHIFCARTVRLRSSHPEMEIVTLGFAYCPSLMAAP
ncbi:hypothetical protein K488DRAFT_70836 [Vararia minispora EC-137]|uniref:Uncharacterized protein n=1 Tax=Vararia minispora EC-137 TaxID=1314806 RepID=A0ACB8QKI9_9AGAM|nr:hypothetical protein K488DRAFT_70836 [Vararia minispora EC-137]